MTGVAMKSLRVPLPPSSYLASLGLQSNFQSSLPSRIEGVDPAVAAGEDDLRLAVDHAVGGIGPLAVLDQLAAIDELS